MSKVITGIDRAVLSSLSDRFQPIWIEEARKIHDTTPLASAGLGRVLTGAGLMGLMLKTKGRN